MGKESLPLFLVIINTLAITALVTALLLEGFPPTASERNNYCNDETTKKLYPYACTLSLGFDVSFAFDMLTTACVAWILANSLLHGLSDPSSFLHKRNLVYVPTIIALLSSVIAMAAPFAFLPNKYDVSLLDVVSDDRRAWFVADLIVSSLALVSFIGQIAYYTTHKEELKEYAPLPINE